MLAEIGKRLVVVVLLTIAGSRPALAVNPQVSPPPRGDLSQWEQRLLGHQYSNDPLDKRIQRLELLVFGATQDGSLSERLTQLKSEITSRATVKTSKSDVTQSLTQLEQKILKKTFGAEAINARLARLETKLFGKSNPSMAPGDRIDRLKKTIGIGEPPPIADESTGERFFRGPLGRDFGQFNHDFGGGRMVIPFGGPQSMMPDDMNKQMSQMFRQLNEQLRELHRSDGVEPRMMPRSRGLRSPNMPMIPNLQSPKERSDEDLPPYMDPNSI